MIISCSNGVGLSEWNCWSSGLHSEEIPVGGNCCALNVVDLWVVSLGRASRSCLLPYPRFMASLVAPRLFFDMFLEKNKLKDDSSNDADWVHDLRFILIAA